MKIINLWGGPGSGKSSTAAGLFHKMKYEGERVELVTEFAKEKVYERNYEALANQPLVLAEQDHRLRRLIPSKLDYVISDSPLMLSIMYAQPPWKSGEFFDLVRHTFATYDNVNFLLRRVKPYQDFGRTQKEIEAVALDRATEALLRSEGLAYYTVDGDEFAHNNILSFLKGNR